MSAPAFGRRLAEFYDGLAADNSKTYWQQHKSVYERDVAEPLRALAEVLAPEFGEAKIFRPYRDVRFSADKRPYQEHASMAVDRDGTDLYLQVSADGLLLAGGLYQPSPDQLDRFRRLQDDDAVTADLDGTLAGLAAAGCPLDDGDPVRTAPRGYRRDHPRIELIRRKRLTVGAEHPAGRWLTDDRCLERIRSDWRTISEWNEWLHRHVGRARPS